MIGNASDRVYDLINKSLIVKMLEAEAERLDKASFSGRAAAMRYASGIARGMCTVRLKNYPPSIYRIDLFNRFVTEMDKMWRDARYEELAMLVVAKEMVNQVPGVF